MAVVTRHLTKCNLNVIYHNHVETVFFTCAYFQTCGLGVCKQHSGINLEVSEQPHSMRQVVNLIIALNRMKARSTEFTDDELCNILFENFQEGNSNFLNSFPFYLSIHPSNYPFIPLL